MILAPGHVDAPAALPPAKAPARTGTAPAEPAGTCPRNPGYEAALSAHRAAVLRQVDPAAAQAVGWQTTTRER